MSDISVFVIISSWILNIVLSIRCYFYYEQWQADEMIIEAVKEILEKSIKGETK